MRAKRAEESSLEPNVIADVARIVSGIPIPRPFSMNALVDRLNRLRDKPIRLMRGDLKGTMPTGMLLRTETADYIVVIRDVERGHARHIHFHELGHILLEDAEVAGPCLPVADPRRCEADEFMAEEFAYQLAERVDAHALDRNRSGENRACAALGKTFAAAADLRDANA
ncbi:hypothetical protein ATK30_0212 [Amycolatopsis echigonensis]|uniref:IrrE N-terminal-like domain-containing protein n=1 Tax=Amycolatopsis echigonensis TaxID=2576905 RepID=A0A2N3X1Y3_9PSEU|nr:hypothetical protein [Amycolatopsis niigatensis]PKW00128.1 hypothetical protein ATK30_0212 [Amycolatopsis niigatensis]